MKYFILIALLSLHLTLQKSPTPISVNEEVTFNTENNTFQFNYKRQTDKASLFFLFYEKTGDLELEFSIEGSEKSDRYKINLDEGYLYFPYTNDEFTYILTFISENASGKIKIANTELPITLDITKDINFEKIYYDSELDSCPLILVLENKSEKDLMKKIKNDDDYLNISMSENNQDYKDVKNDLLYFQKGIKYYMKIEFFIKEYDRLRSTEVNSYVIYPFSIIDFDMNNVTMKKFELGPIYNEKYRYVFTKINLNDIDSFHIKTNMGSCELKHVFLNDESQLNIFPKNIQYLNLTYMKDSFIFEKPENTNYMILFIDYGELDVVMYFVNPIPIKLNEEREINGTNAYFKLNYTKKDNQNEIIYIFYELENENSWVQIASEERIMHEDDLKKKGTVDYLLTESNEYFIFFYLMPPITGKFKIVSSEYEFTVDAKEELYIPKNNYKAYEGTLNFNFTNIDKNYIKLFSSTDELENITSYRKKDNEKFVPMENPLFLLEKGESIKIKVNASNIKSDFLHISNIDEKQVLELSNQNYEFKNPLNQIFKINYLKMPYFKIEGDNSTNYYISYVTEDQYKKIPEGIEKLSFSKNTNDILHKPDKYYYAVLISEVLKNSSLTIKELEKPLNDLVFDSELSFDSFKSNYKLNFQKADNKEVNLLLYKINENGQDFEIRVVAPDSSEVKESISSKFKNGIFVFELGEDGDYKLIFNSDKNFEGTFKLVNTSDELKMNMNEDVRYKSFKTNFKPNPIIMVFNNDEKNPVIYKKLFVGDDNKLLNLVQIAEDNSTEYQNLSFNLFAFESGKQYKVKIDYNELENNVYKLEQFSMTNFTENNLEDFKLGIKQYKSDERNIAFLKIDFNNKLPKIEVKSKNNPKFKIAYHKDDANLTTIINDLTFEDLPDNKYISEKSDNSYKKATLMIELNPGDTEIEFKEYNEGGGNNEGGTEENNDGNLTLILAIAIPVGIILLLIVVFLICRCCKRKNSDIEFREDGQQKDEILMPETA